MSAAPAVLDAGHEDFECGWQDGFRHPLSDTTVAYFELLRLDGILRFGFRSKADSLYFDGYRKGRAAKCTGESPLTRHDAHETRRLGAMS